MKKWTRWQDWVTVIAGAYVALSTLWTENAGASTTLMVIGGVLLVIVGLVNLAMPGMPALEWAQAVIALLVVLAPWMGSYSHAEGPAWSSWIPGIVALVVTVLAIKPSTAFHREHHAVPSH